MSRELLQQALDALKEFKSAQSMKVHWVIAALEQELAKPEQEPVAQIRVKKGHWIETPRSIKVKSLPDGLHDLYTAPPRKERELEQAIREERGRCHQLVWDYGFSKVGNNDVQEACATLAKRILAMGKK